MKNNEFKLGFAKGIALWNNGWTFEGISNRDECDMSAFGRGMAAAKEALAGWVYVLPHEAKEHGLSQAEIEDLEQALKAAK